jgi:FKBP-type peptidyl-prolyl cis-trans isomerase FkpA
MSRTKLFISILISLLLVSCKHKQEYPGYSKSNNGVFYKLLKINDNENRCQYGDYITADITYKTLKDSVFFKGRRKFQINPPIYKGSVDECFTMLGKEESASFILSASNFFTQTLGSSVPGFLISSDKMKIEAEIIDIQTSEDYKKEKEAFLKWIEDFGEYEKVVLRQYVEGSKMNLKPASNGLYYLILKPGNQKAVHMGDTIVVHYEGRFLNGKFFDSTRKRNEAFQFVYGQQWQVIKGMEEAIGMMHEGERALFILPSDLAFGETGSSTGIIPPFTSLIFDVELESVN